MISWLRRAWPFLPATAYTAVVFAFGAAPTDPTGAVGQVGDKWAHFAGFGLLALLLVVPLVLRAPGLGRAGQLVMAFCLAVSVGIALEAVQSALPYRSAELADVVADASGALCAIVVAALALRWAPQSLTAEPGE